MDLVVVLLSCVAFARLYRAKAVILIEQAPPRRNYRLRFSV